MLMRRRSFLAALVAAGAAPMLSRAGVRLAESVPRGLPIGSVVEVAGRSSDLNTVRVTMVMADAGWLPCDGREIPRAQYPALFEALGTTYGGGPGSFSVPDLRGQFVRYWA